MAPKSSSPVSTPPAERGLRASFFTSLKPKLSKSHLVGMDGNCVFNPHLDTSRPDGLPRPAGTEGTAELRNALEEHNLTAIMRETLGDTPHYTNTVVLEGGVEVTRKRIDHIHTPHLDAIIWKFIPATPDILPYHKYGHSMIHVDMQIVKKSADETSPSSVRASSTTPTSTPK